MNVYVTLKLRNVEEEQVRRFNSKFVALTWLTEYALPKYGDQIVHIHIDHV